MIVGIDIGGTTTDAVAIKGKNVIRVVSITASDPVAAASGALGKLIATLGCSLSDIETIVATGGGAASLDTTILGIPLKKIDEISAIGIGGRALAGLDEALVVSMGTGTPFVSVKDTKITHVGGTGVGGGCLMGLAKHILNINTLKTLEALAEKGNLRNVDLTVGDIAGGPVGALPTDATASNFGKLSEDSSDADRALAIINLIAETLLVLSVFAARSCDQKNIVLTGKLIRVKKLVDIMKDRGKMFEMKFIVPKYGEYATAIGAAMTVREFTAD
ncbi:MAG: pantothenate kinase [Theionarchaea archaeon]|nr:pantothenate kinase [Theionarchaea archaeon]MBU7001429.1 pantothenate kinase [Theionarchaea archaeon]MBU7021890.1 pantothenate kinase [Theionarchaea archaeon]MBU7034342.1 pantothenate kinase [Theionarchaea archaeon]MBU7040307.1 pantothenate kinase [Theionarchaea archaeon]